MANNACGILSAAKDSCIRGEVHGCVESELEAEAQRCSAPEMLVG